VGIIRGMGGGDGMGVWREVAERLSWHSVDSDVAVRDVMSPRAYVLDG